MGPTASSTGAVAGNAQPAKAAEDVSQRFRTLLLAAAVFAVLLLLAAAAVTSRPLFLVRPPITRRTSGFFQFTGNDCTRVLASGEWTDDFVTVRCTNDTAAEFATCGDTPRRHWRFSAAATACGARRRARAEARAQLVGRRVTFAGDSIARNLYAATLRLLGDPAQTVVVGHADFQHDLDGGVALRFRWAPYPDNLTALLQAGELAGAAVGGQQAAAGSDDVGGEGQKGAGETPAEAADGDVEEENAEEIEGSIVDGGAAPATVDNAQQAAGGAAQKAGGSRRRRSRRHRRLHQAGEQQGEQQAAAESSQPPPLPIARREEQRDQPPAQLVVLSATLWHLLHVTADDDFAARLRQLGAAAGALLDARSDAARQQPPPARLFLASGSETFPNRMRALDKRQSMTPANVDAYNSAMQEAGLLAPGGPLALLDLLPLTRSCGEECSVDGVHSQPEVYDAALQLLLALDAATGAAGAAGAAGGGAQRQAGER